MTSKLCYRISPIIVADMIIFAGKLTKTQ